MEVQVSFVNVDRPYSYDCINKVNIGNKVIILEGALVGREGIVIKMGRGDYNGLLYKCWRPEFDYVEDIILLDEIQKGNVEIEWERVH